ncbi:Clusterin-associated protein 1 [Orchesella cincta]|uniref:Clusterin-associated protein 1 n=1 Tax=Orchesella cincta TaxID=48709 RepID=A0A1D2MW20_ORCCI|nr:Clusterin-associated protein 1 [Orchesella cincta]
MSYRDLRNLAEMLRAVGYPRMVSVENFRNPNFPLVADIGRWLVSQYEPKTDFPHSVETEHDRVLFVRLFAEFMVTKVQVKLNTKRLYQADGYAVKELIKVVSVLHNAMRGSERDPRDAKFDDRPFDMLMHDLKELKGVREIASALTQRGVTLYDLLNKEVSLREIRQAALSKAYEHEEVERLLKGSVQMMSQEMSKLSGMIDSVQSNLASLDGKIEKRRGDLDRSQKRLLTLKKVRPAFMDEFEQLQTELSQVYKVYVNRFRCLAFLQNRIEEMNREDSERKAEEKLNRAEQNSYGGDDFLYSGLKGDGIYSGSDDESSDEMHLLNDANLNLTTGRSSFTSKQSQSGATGIAGNSGNRTATVVGAAASGATVNGLRQPSTMNGGAQSSRARNRQMYGTMMGPEEDSEESESDLILVDGDNDNSELGSDEPDDDDLVQIQKAGVNSGADNNRRSNLTSRQQHFQGNNDMNHYMNGGIGDPPPVPAASTNPSAEMINYGGGGDAYNNYGGMGNGDLSHNTGAGGYIMGNGGPNHSLANGGKGYPVDNLKNGSSSGKRLQGQASRPTTSGKRRGPSQQARRVTDLDDDDEDF